MKRITIELISGEVKIDLEGIESYNELIASLASFEGVIGGIMEIDKGTLRDAVDEAQEVLQAQLPDGVVVEDDDGMC